MLAMTEAIKKQSIIQNPLEGALKLNLFQKSHRALCQLGTGWP